MRVYAVKRARCFVLFLVAALCALSGSAHAQFTSTTSNGAVTITGYTGNSSSVTIPSQINSLPVTAVGNYAFNFNANITSITIPSSITNIGTGAFSGTGVTSMSIPSGVTTIGPSAFSDCANMTSVSIPNTVTSIGASAFSLCSNLTNVTIPASVTSIGAGAFNFCANLTAINVNSGNPNYSSSGGVLFDPSQTTLLEFPSGVTGGYGIPGSVTTIASGAFNSASLSSVTIPTSVTSIAAGAFNFCANLTSINVNSGNPAYSSINGVVFDPSQTVLEICPTGTTGVYSIPTNVTVVGTGAFNYCANLTNVVFSSTVTTIGAQAFQSSNLTSVIIPPNVTNIGPEAFNNCLNLTVIFVIPGNPAYSSVSGVLFDANQDTLVEFPSGLGNVSYTIPSSVNSIGAYAFANTGVTGVTIPSSVTSIGPDAFNSCTNITTLNIPSSVSTISGNAFGFCLSLGSVNFTGNAPNTDPSAFYQDSAAKAYYPSVATGYGSTIGGITAVALTPPSFSTQAANKAVVAGVNTTFTVGATGTPTPTYQWQVSTDGGVTWNNVSGTQYTGGTNTKLTVKAPTIAQSGYQYRAIAMNSSGAPSTSTPVSLVVGYSSTYLTWLSNNFSSTQLGTPAVIAPSAEPAGDGLANILKYAFGLPALVNGRNALPQATASNGVLSLSFSPSRTDVTYSVQASTDLSTWSSTNVTASLKQGVETATYPLSGNTPAFLRIQVTPGLQ